MKPIISPWLIWMIGRLDSLIIFFSIVASLATVAIVILGVMKCTGEDMMDKKWKRLPKKYLGWAINLCWIFSLLAILTPSRNEAILMIVAKNVTPVNIEKAVGAGQDIHGAIKQDILDIIAEIKKEPRSPRKEDNKRD